MKQRVEDAAFQFHELLLRAVGGPANARRYLPEAEVRLNQLRLYVRLCMELKTMHEERAQTRPVSESTTFLGFRVFPDHRLLNARRGHYARRRLRMLTAQVAAGHIPLAQLTVSAQSWVAHAAHGDAFTVQNFLQA